MNSLPVLNDKPVELVLFVAVNVDAFTFPVKYASLNLTPSLPRSIAAVLPSLPVMVNGLIQSLTLSKNIPVSEEPIPILPDNVLI